MNIYFPRRRPLSAAMGLVSALLLAPTAGAATIVATLSTASPVIIGQQFDVTLSVSGWDSSDGEVDGVSFLVSWNPTLFEFISDSPDTSASSFIQQSTQGAGFAFSDDTDTTFVAHGVYLFGVSDSGDATAGSVGGDAAGGVGGGILGSFTLEALAVGSDTFDTSTNNVNGVFADKNLNGIPQVNITGGITFGSSPTMEVIPEPSIGLLAILGGGVLLAGRRRRTA